MLGPDGIRDALARGVAVPDLAFDRVFPLELRARSPIEWTPVAVAVRLARLLDGAASVLDVGAGAGKACLVGALAGAAAWTGIEQDPVLVDAAAAAAHHLGADRARVALGDALALDWDPFDAIYLFNPFGVLRRASPPGTTFPRFAARANPTQVRRTTAKLAALKPGTRVVTYHGFGGDMPDALTLVARERAASDALALWRR